MNSLTLEALLQIIQIIKLNELYPASIEVKGGADVLQAEVIYITSNLQPRLWYPGLDEKTINALLRQ